MGTEIVGGEVFRGITFEWGSWCTYYWLIYDADCT